MFDPEVIMRRQTQTSHTSNLAARVRPGSSACLQESPSIQRARFCCLPNRSAISIPVSDFFNLICLQGESTMSKKSKSASINIGINENDRAKIVEGLSALLADSFTLYMMTHNFHWNVTGPQFNSLHAMFMDQYTEQWNALDIIAERIRALGHPAPGTFAEFAKLTSVKEVSGVPKATDMVRHLSTLRKRRHARRANCFRWLKRPTTSRPPIS